MEPISLSDTEEIEEEIVTNMEVLEEELPVVKSEPLEVEVNNVNDIQALFNPDDIPTPKGMLKVYMLLFPLSQNLGSRIVSPTLLIPRFLIIRTQ